MKSIPSLVGKLSLVGLLVVSAALVTCGVTKPTSTALNNCPDASFADRSAVSADRTISFGGSAGLAFSPPCMAIAAGQSVSFSGDFSLHPLNPGSSPGMTFSTSGSANNPIPVHSTGSAPAVVTFPTAGIYPYYCGVHFGGGMFGVVKVQ